LYPARREFRLGLLQFLVLVCHLRFQAVGFLRFLVECNFCGLEIIGGLCQIALACDKSPWACLRVDFVFVRSAVVLDTVSFNPVMSVCCFFLITESS